MAATLRGYWAEAEGYQKLLYAVAAFLLVGALFHLSVLAVRGGSLHFADLRLAHPVGD